MYTYNNIAGMSHINIVLGSAVGTEQCGYNMPFNILPTYTCNIWAKDVHHDVMTNIHIDHIGSYRYMIMIRTYSYVYLYTYGLHVGRLIRYILLAHIGPLFTFSLGDTKQKNICCLIFFKYRLPAVPHAGNLFTITHGFTIPQWKLLEPSQPDY